MQVRRRRPAGAARRDRSPARHRPSPGWTAIDDEMGVARLHPALVLDNHHVAVTAAFAGKYDRPGSRGRHVVAVGRAQVDAAGETSAGPLSGSRRQPKADVVTLSSGIERRKLSVAVSACRLTSGAD